MILDFNHLTSEQTRRLNEIADANKKLYTEFVDQCAVMHNGRIQWWLTHFANRNSEYTELQIYKYLLFEDEVLHNELSEVHVDNIGLYKVISKCLKQRNKTIKVIGPSHNIKNSGFVRVIIYFVLWLKKVKEFNAIKKNMQISIESGAKVDLLIDTYVLENTFTENGEYRDRYFNGIMDYYPDTYFSTILLRNNIGSFQQFLQKVKNEKKYKFIVKELYLSIWDYLKMLRHPFSCLRFANKKYMYQGIDVSSIVKTDILRGSTSLNTLDGYISYAFLKKMKKRNIKINDSIIWYEGQPSNAGFVAGINKYYPKTPVKGYLGFPIGENWLSLCPSGQAVKDKISPSSYGVIGQKWVDTAKYYTDNIDVRIFPAFRYYTSQPQNINTTNVDKTKTNLLLVLPGVESDAIDLLVALQNMISQNENSFTSVQVYYKNHPNFEHNKIEDYRLSNSYKFQDVHGVLSDIVSQYDIAVTSYSSSSMEMISQGTFLIAYVEKGKLKNFAIPKDEYMESYKIAYSSEDIKCIINDFLYKKPECEHVDITNLFEPITQESCQRMRN